jgi:hypothetical protein
MLMNALSDKDLTELSKHNVRMVMTHAPACCFHIPPTEGKVHLLCFDSHTLGRFPKEHIVAMILHEMGHVLNPNLSGDEFEFKTDDYAIDRGFGAHLASCLERGIELELVDFDEEMNHRRIERIRTLVGQADV